MNIIGTKLSLSLSAFLVMASLLPTQSTATDTIAASAILRDNDNGTLISSRGDFELGFYSPEGSKNRYVGIWYKKISNRTVVWVANRDDPLTDTSGELKLLHPGLLVLLNSTNGSIIWSTNASRSVQSPVAQLLDSGNLVVRDAGDDNPEAFLWQSFNYPCDTFLPGMKVGKNMVTGLEIFITSSKSGSDPASGDYTYYCDTTGYPQNMIRKGDAVIFRTGPWNGEGFSGNPNLQRNSLFTYGMIINETEVFYSYDLLNDSPYMRFTLSESGYGTRLVWVERTQVWSPYLVIPGDSCDLYNGCGPYGSCNIKNSPSCGCLDDRFMLKDPQSQVRGDWSNGCIRRTPLNCEEGDGFVKYSGLKLPDTRSSRYNKSMSLDECRAVCLRDCSCMAYSSLDISRGESGCLLWYGDLVDIRVISPGQDIFIRMASSELESNGKKRRIFVVALSVAVGLLLLCLGLLLYLKKRKKLEHQPRKSGRQRFNYLDNHPDQSEELELPMFDLSMIIKATDNFSINHKLGEGGFGSVYMGHLEEGQEIAVKRLSSTSVQGVDEFKNEVICIAKLQHRNLVKLLGCCIQGEEKMLVYEYMNNRSLDLTLFDPLRSILLDWPMRFNIINGVARGLMYLHQDSRLRVIHRDLKASNILLDANMNPKISDFGIARIFGGNETGANTSRVVGTYGYMSPEYAMDGLFSVKSDVYSFGVVVLEIVSGMRNRGIFRRDQRLNLLGHAWMLYREERSLELLDPRVRDTCYLSEVARSIHIGLLCVQEEPEERPSMSSVVVMLSNDGALPEARFPGFFTRRDTLQYENLLYTSTSSSSNSMTITLPEPR